MESILLDFPYISQINGKGTMAFWNDCGPACCWMLIQGYEKLGKKESVDSLYQSMVKNEDRYTSWMENISILRSHGVYPHYRWKMSLADLDDCLNDGFAVMALINYGVLNDSVQTYSSFSGNHFVLVVGMNEKFYFLHDPLWLDEDGKNWAVKKNVFENAWMHADGAQRSGLVMTEKLNENEKIVGEGIVSSSIGLNLRMGKSIHESIVGRLYVGDVVKFGEIYKIDATTIWGRLVNTNVWCAINYRGAILVTIKQDSTSSDIKDKLQQSIQLLEEILFSLV